MAFRSNNPITVALPAFRGVTRQIILATLVVYFGLLVLGLAFPQLSGLLQALLSIEPRTAFKMIWQIFTYPFINLGLFTVLFAALSVWFFGAALEDELGSRWMGELFLACTIGGGIVASLITFAIGLRVPGLSPYELGRGLWPFAMALLVIFAALHADQELNFNFILHVKAKYIAAIYLLVYLAVALSSQQRFDAVLVLSNVLCGWLFLRFVPRHGIRFAGQEKLYGAQNAWVRARRRRAAKKFAVYMQKQGREVHFDQSGRYIDPDGKQRDPNDRKWMN